MNIKTFRLPQALHSQTERRRAGRVKAWLCVLALSWAPVATAQATQEAIPETVEEEPRLTDGVELLDGIQRSLDGPDVVITAGKDRTVFEYRQNGQLRLVKIVPRLGRPYYLVPADQTRGFGDLGQADMLLPQWTIIEF